MKRSTVVVQLPTKVKLNIQGFSSNCEKPSRKMTDVDVIVLLVFLLEASRRGPRILFFNVVSLLFIVPVGHRTRGSCKETVPHFRITRNNVVE